MRAMVPGLALLAWIGAARAEAPEMPWGKWVIAGQVCAGCTGTAVAPDLNGATLVIDAHTYQDAVIGTDVCPGAPVLHPVASGPIATVLARPPRIAAGGLAAQWPPDARSIRVMVDCAGPALAPFTGGHLADLVYVPPNLLLHVWNDNVLLFKRKVE